MSSSYDSSNTSGYEVAIHWHVREQQEVGPLKLVPQVALRAWNKPDSFNCKTRLEGGVPAMDATGYSLSKFALEQDRTLSRLRAPSSR